MIQFLFTKPKVEIKEDYLGSKMDYFCNRNGYSKHISLGGDSTLPFVLMGELKKEANIPFEMQVKTYSKIQQLEVKLKISEGVDVDRNIEKLKLLIKDELLKDWHECIWLSDSQSSYLSEKLYLEIHKLETLFREVINRIMMNNFGYDWWQTHTSAKIKKRYNERGRDFPKQVPAFKGVNDKLLAVDIDDLVDIMKYRIKKFEINDGIEIINSYESLSFYGNLDDTISNYRKFSYIVNKSIKVEKDLWEELFSNYFTREFEAQWNKLKKGRNHIAHNKLLDTNASKKIFDEIKELETYLKSVRDKIEQEPSFEEISILAEELHNEESMKYLIEQETGVTIYDANQIVEKYKEIINAFLSDLTNEIYFRQDIDFEFEEFSGEETYQELLVINREWENKLLSLQASLAIEEEAVSILTLEVYINDKLELTSNIEFQNGQVEYDNENCYYIPLAYDDLDMDSFEEFKEELNELVETEFHYYLEDLEHAQESSYRDGGNESIAEFYCENCGNQSVSINDDILPFGKCANCGYEHTNIQTCKRCECLYNASHGGGLGLCDSCYDYYIEE